MRSSIPFALMVLIATNAFSAFVIDDFTQGSTAAHTSQGQEAWVDTGINVLGTVRDGSVGCESSIDDGTSTAQITGGKFEVTTNWKASPSIYLGYDATSGWGTAGLDINPFNGAISTAVDLTQSGVNNSFAITFSYANEVETETPFFNDFLFTVKVKDDATLYTCNMGFKGTKAANDWMDDNYLTLQGKTSATFLVPFSELTGGTPDLSQVEAFSLHICSNSSDMDYSLDSIATTVPEPATALLLAIGGGLTWLLRLKQRW